MKIKLRWPKALTPRKWRNETSNLKYPEEWLVNALLNGMQSASKIPVNEHKALGLATVFSCTNVVSETVATLPFKLMRRQGKKRDVATDHPLNDLISNVPNREMTSTDFRLAMQGALSLRKNAFAQIRRNRAKEAVELIPIHPSQITKRRVGTGRDRRIVYEHRPPNGEQGTFEFDRMLHLRGLSSTGLIGRDLIGTVTDVIGLAIALETNASKFFANDSRPGIILSHEKTLSEDAQERLKKALDDRMGVDNWCIPMVLEEGLKLDRLRDSNKDSEFEKSRERQDYAIARVFRMPPHKIGLLERATFSNIEHQGIEFVSDTIMPQVVIWEQQCNMMLLTEKERAAGFYFKFNLGGLLRGDLLSRFKAYAIARQWGWFSADDVLELEDRNPLPDGQGETYLSPMNMVPAGELEVDPDEPDDGGEVTPPGPNGNGRTNGAHRNGNLSALDHMRT